MWLFVPASRHGLYGEAWLAPARSLINIPNAVSFESAAATWAACGTAWAGLVTLGRLAAGQTVLLPAASSSVGVAATIFLDKVGDIPAEIQIALLRVLQEREIEHLGQSHAS